MSTEALRIVRFCLVGVTNTLVTLGAFALLVADEAVGADGEARQDRLARRRHP